MAEYKTESVVYKRHALLFTTKVSAIGSTNLFFRKVYAMPLRCSLSRERL